jgi:hypothetical protein
MDSPRVSGIANASLRERTLDAIWPSRQYQIG